MPLIEKKSKMILDEQKITTSDVSVNTVAFPTMIVTQFWLVHKNESFAVLVTSCSRDDFRTVFVSNETPLSLVLLEFWNLFNEEMNTSCFHCSTSRLVTRTK